MPLILHIDTAGQNATVSLADNETILASANNNNQKDHASFLQPGIEQLFKETGLKIRNLEAVSVTAGPGSYTGLRVGMASAKGICYALNIPLISLNTLEVMACAIIKNTLNSTEFLYCPMIDAGRMEVFTAIYDENLNEILSASAIILEPGIFDKISEKKAIISFGNGAFKFKNLSPKNILWYDDALECLPALTFLSLQKFNKKAFADLKNAVPVYLKQFYTFAKS